MTIDQTGETLDSTGEPLTRTPDAIRPGVNAVIFNDRGEVLMEHRSDNGFWGLPGGGVEIGESVEQAVVREVFEETGLEVTVERFVGLYSDPKYYSIMRYPSGNLVHYVTFLFECRRSGGAIRISGESTEICYFDVDALPEKTLLAHAVHIRDAAANRPEAFIK